MGNQDQDGRLVLPTDHDEGLDKTATKKWYYEFVAHQGRSLSLKKKIKPKMRNKA